MAVSILTTKGQTTIPKEIRAFLKLEAKDRILYQVENDRVIMRSLKGNILDLRGRVKTEEKPVDFERIREVTKKRIAHKIVEGDK
jgi:bifunctional DNA-binding transcriptional regulator/antitoxin component of YhaV-PrlF toxin-antitoxin module